MPTISNFYGITIHMYSIGSEHNPPHIHASYGEKEASFSIIDGTLIAGKFPIRASKLVKEFIEIYRIELLKMWETGTYSHLKGLE